MNSSPSIILAIAPGKREFGVAVFDGTDLIYSSVKTIKHRKSNELQFSEVAVIMQILFESFAPHIVVIKAISQYQKLSRELGLILKLIRFESKQAGVQVVEITFEQIKIELCSGEQSTQKKAFESLTDEYPELKRFWNRPNKWQNDYYAFLFSAVAVGAVFLKNRSRM
ncbi:MAG: hypothetical protein ACR2N3_01035 [Pyrinomonadaceae bacterium]